MWIVRGAGLHLGEGDAGGKGVEASMVTPERNPRESGRVGLSTGRRLRRKVTGSHKLAG